MSVNLWIWYGYGENKFDGPCIKPPNGFQAAGIWKMPQAFAHFIFIIVDTFGFLINHKNRIVIDR